jgi:hypothetical protein
MKTARREASEFRAYLRACTDRQVQGVYDREKDAGRTKFATMAREEAASRGFSVIKHIPFAPCGKSPEWT